MKTNTINKQSFGDIKFKNESSKQYFFRYDVAPAVGEENIDCFINKYKTVDNIKDVELAIHPDAVNIKWHGITDPYFSNIKATQEKSLFSCVNEAMNYIILHKELIDMNKF